MKKYSLFFLLILFSISAPAQWVYVGSDGISSPSSAYNKIATDASGNPVIVFLDWDLGKTRCLSYNGSQWDPVGSATLDSFPIGEILQFEIDKNNQYYIAFVNNENYKPSCIRFNGSEWKYVGSQYVSEAIMPQISMAVDTANIVYFVYVLESGAKIVKENAENWDSITTIGLDRSLIYPDLKFDSSNVAYIGYCANLNIKCAKFSDVWVQVGNTIVISSPYPLYTKLNITRSHDLFIVFDNQIINCFKLNNQTNTWNILGEAGLGWNQLFSGDLTSDPQGNVYISTEPVLTGDRARCFTFDGESWVQLGDSGISELSGNVKIEANNAGNLYASCSEGINGKPVVKEYAFPTSIVPVSIKNPVRIYPNPVKGILSIEMPGQKFTVTMLDIRGKPVYMNTPASDKLEISTDELNKGIYIVRIDSGKGALQYRKIIVN